MTKKTVPVQPHKRSTPSPTPRKNPTAPKPGPKTVPVSPHKHTTQKIAVQKLISLPCNNGFVRTGAGNDTLAELVSPAAQTESR